MDDTTHPTGTQATPDRTYHTLMHLSQLSGFIVPLGSIIAPLVMWLMKKGEDPEVDRHGRQILNHQITLLIAGFAAALLCLVAVGFILLPALGIYFLVIVIINTIKSSEGRPTRYPVSFSIL